MKLLSKIYNKAVELITHTTTDNTNSAKVSSLLKDIDTIVNSITSKPDQTIDIKQVAHKNQAYLFKIQDALVGQFAKLYLAPSVLVTSRKTHDKLFNYFNIKQPRKRFAHLPTFLATTFCKGITFFSHNSGIERKPYYHREDSLTKEQIKTCLIERLIYDKIYTHVFYKQDLELKTIEIMFQNNYPNLKIDIDITFSDGIHPNSMTILERYTDVPPKYITHIFNKRWGSDMIYCHKYEDNIKYSKVQTYDHEEAYLVSPS